jgi:predicted RNase H-like HicB family nuclease
MSQFKNIILKEGAKYVAQSLNLDISSFGDSITEALRNLREALELYFEDVGATTTKYS